VIKVEQAVKNSRFWYITQNVKALIITRFLWGISRGLATPYLSLFILALGGTPIEIGLVNMLGLVAGIFLYPLGGYIADKKGRVKLIIYATIVFTVSGLFFVFAWSWEVIAIGHFITQMMLFYTPALNALEADSLPPGERGKGFSIILAVPDATRIIAPYLGGWLISFYGGDDLAVVNAMRLCYGLSVIIGFVIVYIRWKRLQETIVETEEGEDRGDSLKIFQMLKEAYIGMIDSVKWMNRPLKIIVLVEIVTSISVSLAGPFWIVYATEMVGLSAYDFGITLLLSGVFNVVTAYFIGILIDRFKARKMILVSLILGTIFPALYIILPHMVGGFLGVAIVICGVALVNNISMPAYSTIIANLIPRNLRGRLFALLGERGISIAIGQFWGGGFLLFPFAAAGAYLGGYLYLLNPASLWIITSLTMILGFVLSYLYMEEPREVHY